MNSVNYNLNNIKTVHTADDLVNIILSKTQRKTPTEVHPGYEIQRIRSFYMRKVKFCSSSFNEKLFEILDNFPKLDDIHPFYSDLFNILYDKDHYKIALGQINSTKNILDNIAKDYVKLMKYADSLFRCKTLKRAAFGRMCTSVKKLKPSLEYLEEVRKHLSRLPTIDPFAPSVWVTGFPSVGKSSFINNISNANVEVHPMPFTTQSLFVGHSYYNNIRLQILDSPGLLNRELELRNTIEMQAITALAHLKACVLYFIDISEECGYSIEDQIDLFKKLKPLFNSKPHILVFTKIDIINIDNLEEKYKEMLKTLINEYQLVTCNLSNNNSDSIFNLKKTAGDILINYRLNQNPEKNPLLKNEEDYLKGIHVQLPTINKNLNRPPVIPKSVLEKKQLNRPLVKELENEYGGPGVFTFPNNEHHILKNEEWKYDKIPEIIDGKNIADFVDPDIEQKLLELEREEEELIKEDEKIKLLNQDLEYQDNLKTLKQINQSIYEKKVEHSLTKNKTSKMKKISINNLKEKLKDSEKATERILERQNKKVNKIKNKMQIEGETNNKSKSISKGRDIRSRSVSQRGKWNDPTYKGEIMKKKIQKGKARLGLQGDSDRKIFDLKPKHLFSGKRKMGKTDRR